MKSIGSLYSMMTTLSSSEGKSNAFKFEFKFNKHLEKYQNAFDQLEKDFNTVQTSPSLVRVHSLSERLRAIKVIKSKLDQKGLFSNPMVEVLNQQDFFLKQIELFVGQFLAVDSQNHLFNSVEEAILQAKELENGIDFKELTKDEWKGRELFKKYCSDLEKIIACYQHALATDKEEVQNDYEQAMTNYSVFKKFEERLVNNSGYEFRYSINALAGNNVLYPLRYPDRRLQNAFEILLAAPDMGGDIEKCQNLVFKLLCLPPESDVQSVLMQVAKEIICSDSFQEGKEEWDKEDLVEYREEKFKFLDKLSDIAKNEMKWVDIQDIPQKLKVNPKITTHPRMYLLRAAHRLGLSLKDRLEWKIDAWMAEQRYQVLAGYGSDKEQLIYLSRRHQKPLGLLLNPHEDPYHPEHIKEKYRNITEKYMLYHLFQNSYENILNHFLIHSNQSVDFKFMLAKINKENFFEKDNPEKLSCEGARALLYAAGYLEKENQQSKKHV